MTDPWRESEPLPSMYVYEEGPPLRPIIYGPDGTPYQRPRVPLGFIDPNNLPRNK